MRPNGNLSGGVWGDCVSWNRRRHSLASYKRRAGGSCTQTRTRVGRRPCDACISLCWSNPIPRVPGYVRTYTCSEIVGTVSLG